MGQLDSTVDKPVKPRTQPSFSVVDGNFWYTDRRTMFSHIYIYSNLYFLFFAIARPYQPYDTIKYGSYHKVHTVCCMHYPGYFICLFKDGIIVLEVKEEDMDEEQKPIRI